MSLAAISAISPSSYSAATTVSTTQLQRQIAALQKKIAAEQASNDDAQTKAMKVQQYQLQLVQLQLQLQAAAAAKG